ncbi:MAG: glycosyltransferase [Thermoguttaceae bacterium]|nr:glycosyltransferase [Thermoguttaceae bacterium]
MCERLAVVMPVYNEEEAIGPVLRKWAEALSRLGIDFTIFAYNDGSKDHSLEVMRSVAEEYPGRITPVDKPNTGHGPTILLGYRQAVSAGFDWVFQIDSDDEMGPESFSQLWDARGDKDFLVGWRDGRTQALPRKLISAVSRMSVRLLYGKGIHDVNTPYRLMRVSAFREAYESIPSDTFAPNVILTGIAACEGFRDAQFAVPQRDRQTGEVSIKKWKLARAAMKSFCQTIVYSSEHYRRVGLALLMLVFVAVTVLNLPCATNVSHGDIAVYCAAGELQTRGVALYRGFFDHKGPFFHSVYHLSFLLTRSIWGVWFAESLLCGLSIFLMYWALTKRTGCFLSSLWCIGLIVGVEYGFYLPDRFSAELSVLGLALLIGWGNRTSIHFLNGCIASLVFFSKPTYVIFFVAVGLYLLIDAFRKRRISYLLAYVAGGLLTLVFFIAVMYAKGILPAFWDCCIRFNALYAADLNHQPCPLLKVIRYCRYMLPLTLFSLFVGCKYRRKVDLSAAVCWLIFVSWAVWCSSKGWIWSNDCTLARFALFLPALLPVGLWGIPRKRCRSIHFCLLLALFLVFNCGFRYFYKLNVQSLIHAVAIRHDPLPTDPVIDFIRTQPDSSLFAWGLPGLERGFNTKTGRPNPTAFYYRMPFMIDGYFTQERIDDFIARLDAASPCIFVFSYGDPLTERESTVLCGKERPVLVLDRIRGYVRENHYLAKKFDDGRTVYFPNQWRDDPAVKTDP